MSSAIGFTAIMNATHEQETRSAETQVLAAAPFPDLCSINLRVGETTLQLWGRGDLEGAKHILPDGSVIACIGSPVGTVSWQAVDEALAAARSLEAYRISWDGRVVLLHISPDGKEWTFWNDMIGSIPVYYSRFGYMRIASTLEPVVVSAGQLSQDDFFMPGLVSLMVHGNLLFDWTIFKSMHTIKPDSVTTIGEDVRSVFCNTAPATDAHWVTGWDDLVDEMHDLVTKAIRGVLQTRPAWTLPLSSGLDSRLIAAVAAESGTRASAYTWGPPNLRDSIYSRQIAAALGIPWQRVDLPDDYLCSHLPAWVNLFGSAMHFHGMYQLPFIQMIIEKKGDPILSGYLGECFAGYDVDFQARFHTPGKRVYYSLPEAYIHWQTEELKALFCIPVDDALEHIADALEQEKNRLEGSWFQKLHYLTFWSRQNHFTYFQSMLSDYACGVATPYLNRAYARFCMSLPRGALDHRRLQVDMMRRYYATMMTIGGTYAPEPSVLTGKYIVRRRIASKFPERIADAIFPDLRAPSHIKTDVLSLAKCGRQALWPIDDKAGQLSGWLNLDQVEKAYQQGLSGSMNGVRKIQSIQAFAYRLNQAD
jgi:asparagine synthetase B (glutamine-hydrolysing)